jgi:ComF family protein
MFNFIKLLFFPVFCEGCGLLGKSICDKCLMKTHIIKDKQCHNCSQILSTKNTAHICSTINNISSIHSIYEYSGIVRKVILNSKYKLRREPLLFLINNTPTKLWQIPKFYYKKNKAVIIPVPLTLKKRRQRGFSQTEVIAQKLSMFLNIEILNVLIKKNTSSSQVKTKSATQRTRNVKNSFLITGFNKKPFKTAIIVDDVLTTGATIKEVAKTLIDGKVVSENIIVFTLARNK